jgi:predicted ester cyclase
MEILMSNKKNKEIIRRYLEEVINTGNVDKIEDFISPDYVEVYEGKRYPLGIKGAREHIVGVRQTYPDLKVTVEQQIAEGEWIATSIVARGTHLGVWMGIKPTGQVITFTGVNIDRVVNRRIVEHGGASNMLEPLLAVGAIKVVGPEKANNWT